MSVLPSVFSLVIRLFFSPVENISLFLVRFAYSRNFFLSHWQILEKVKRSHLICNMFCQIYHKSNRNNILSLNIRLRYLLRLAYLYFFAMRDSEREIDRNTERDKVGGEREIVKKKERTSSVCV